ncbi:hypothetical protein EON65_23975 [archaeon]|nr:MAG: hypothetical protein EON65_23975 [archaeon]
MQPKAWKTFCSFFVLPMMHTSVASSNSTTQPSLPEHLFRTATNMHSSSSLEASRIMLGDYDEDELHSYINDAFLTRQNSVFASTVQETPSNELSRRQSSMFGTIPPENSSVSAGTNLSSGTKQDITSRDSFL